MSNLGPRITEPEHYSIDKVDFKNDRCILYLIDHKSSKNRADKSMLNKLKRRYPDYDTFDIHIRTYLYGLELIDPEYSEPVNNRYTKVSYFTNKKGEEAVKNGRFPSEYKLETKNRNKDRCTIIGIAVACISSFYAIYVGVGDRYCGAAENKIESIRIDTIIIPQRDTVYIPASNLDKLPVE